MAKHRRKLKRYVRRSKVSPQEAERLLPWFKAIPELEKIATEIRSEARHYQGFSVGLAALLRRSDGSTYTVSGANAKKAPGPRQPGDHCAEEAMYRGDEVLGFVVVAPHKIDDFSNIDLGVTISCGHCRQRFRKFDSADGIRPYTRARYVNADESKKCVEVTVDALLGLCSSEDNRNVH